MSEGGEYTRSSWVSDYDFRESRRYHEEREERSYAEAKAQGIKEIDRLPRRIETPSKWPFCIRFDNSRSMKGWPAPMIAKLPYLKNEFENEYFGKDVAISIGAYSDATYGDEYSLQIRPFCRCDELRNRATELVHPQDNDRGGPYVNESAELVALYDLHNTIIPNAVVPILVIVTDELPYEKVDKEQAYKYAFLRLERQTMTEQLFVELKQKFRTYIVRKLYLNQEGNVMSDVDSFIHSEWVDLVGKDHIAVLPSADRIVDVLFGIAAKETDRLKYFQKELGERQTCEQVDQVYASLDDIFRGKEVVYKSKEAKKKSGPLI